MKTFLFLFLGAFALFLGILSEAGTMYACMTGNCPPTLNEVLALIGVALLSAAVLRFAWWTQRKLQGRIS